MFRPPAVSPDLWSEAESDEFVRALRDWSAPAQGDSTQTIRPFCDMVLEGLEVPITPRNP